MVTVTLRRLRHVASVTSRSFDTWSRHSFAHKEWNLYSETLWPPRPCDWLTVVEKWRLGLFFYHAENVNLVFDRLAGTGYRRGQVTPGVVMSHKEVGRQDSIPGLILRHVLVLETRQRENPNFLFSGSCRCRLLLVCYKIKNIITILRLYIDSSLHGCTCRFHQKNK